MYLQRSIDQTLLEWSQAESHKPLILRGARQTGKTEAIRHLGSHFELFIELNLERFEDLALVRAADSADELLLALRARLNISDFPARTLLFIDEIQESAEAIQWLRFLYEDHPQIAVVGAGSLMEVRLRDKGFSFPVGRVTFKTLRPFSFFEVLRASGKEVLAQSLEQAVRVERILPTTLPDQARRHLHTYLQVGGMPEALVRWTETEDPRSARQVHTDLLQALAEDLQKYQGVRDRGYLEAAFANLRHHYGLRFKYENFAPGYRSQLMHNALSKMESAHLITRVVPTSSLEAPLQVRPRAAPKLLPLDTALALTSMGFDTAELTRSPIEAALGGRIAEMFVGQELVAASDSLSDLFFWISESSRSNAEVDFLISSGNDLLPIEVKASAAGSLKSLHQFLWRSGRRQGIRLYEGRSGAENLSVKMQDGDFEYRLRSLPLWAASLLA